MPKTEIQSPEVSQPDVGEFDNPTALDQFLSDKYRIVRFIAKGGMGEVYEARHARLQSRVAIKVLRPELADRPKFLKRFEREACVAGGLEHEHIVRVVDIDANARRPFIVMEYVEGETLWHWIRRGPMPATRAIALGLQLCRALCAAHDAGVIHRDLKPANIILSRRADGSDSIKVLDFGLARPLLEHHSRITATGAVVGTPNYMAPEQARGDESVDIRADVHALGAILYELLCARKAHPGNSYHSTICHLLTEPVVPLGQLRPDLPQDLCEVVHKALASEPAKRYESMHQFGAALRGCAVSVQAADALSTRTATIVDAGGLAADPRKSPAPSQRRSWSVALLGALGVAIGFGAAQLATPALATLASSNGKVEAARQPAQSAIVDQQQDSLDETRKVPPRPTSVVALMPAALPSNAALPPELPMGAPLPGETADKQQPQLAQQAHPEPQTAQRTQAAPAAKLASSSTASSRADGSRVVERSPVARLPASHARAARSATQSTQPAPTVSGTPQARLAETRAQLASVTMGALSEALRRLRETPIDG